ncbi:transmembrane protein 252 [Ambystoma mexicanum]|uniref:transmembrane protein 252 n=1 Tax=Ambystoma mexicanum TaxID=8296 RepID=UPI0037E8BB81
MEIRKSIFSVLRFSLLIIGFSLVCLGAFYVSTSYVCNCGSEMVLAYSLLPLGFLFLLVGIFWSTYHEANHKSLFHTVMRQFPRQREMHIETVDRPDFYPPSYEESQDLELQHYAAHTRHVTQEEGSYNTPPPLYTESSLEVIQETSGPLELPPSYEASVQRQPAAIPPSGDRNAAGSSDTSTESASS